MQNNDDNTIKFSIDENNPPQLTTEDRVDLAAIASMPDEKIDYTDAPERPTATWSKPVKR